MAEQFRTPYESYDVLVKWDSPSWDDTTREVVRKRLQQVPEREFLEPDEWATLEAVCARLVPQPERGADAVPIVPWIDRKLRENRGVGYRYEEMPPLRDAWRLGIAGIEREARRRHHTDFTRIDAEQQDGILGAIQGGEVAGEPWERLPPGRFFTAILLKTVVGIYYAHPAAWSEVGFGGPASPRGYVRRGLGGRDPWEAKERWNPAVPLEEAG
jgi:hypothetical protein